MLRDIRNNYQQNELLEQNMHIEPLTQFRVWLDEAIAKDVAEPTAMVLSTIDGGNRPQARVVLLKDLSAEGFVFFSNYESAKGNDMSLNSAVSLTFFWPELERQVRISGNVRKTSDALSDDYFHSRPIDSQLGAWTSPQSRVIVSKEMLDKNFEKYRDQFGDQIPRPPNWGGYIVVPDQIEFWQGRPNRLHDRIRYVLENNKWRMERLAP